MGERGAVRRMGGDVDSRGPRENAVNRSEVVNILWIVANLIRDYTPPRPLEEFEADVRAV